MRDVEQMEEKFEVTLDGRKVAALAAGALILMCCVFALGLALGRRLAPTPGPMQLEAMDFELAPEAAHGTARDGAAAQQGAHGRADSGRAAAAPSPAQASAGQASAGQASATPASAAEVAKQAEAHAAQPAAIATPPASAAQGATGTQATATQAASATRAAAPGDAVVEAKADDDDPPAEDAPAADAPPVKVAAPAKEPIVVPPPAAPKRAPGSLPAPPAKLLAFTVQIGASPERSEAERLTQKAIAAGLHPYVVEADLGPKGLWYRVRVGSFADKAQAADYKKDVERELHGSALVMSTH